MNALNRQTHEIVVYPNRKRLVGVTSIVVFLYLFIVGMDVFTIWAFWNHYEIDTGAYVAAFILLIGTVFIGWIIFVTLLDCASVVQQLLSILRASPFIFPCLRFFTTV